LAQSCRPKRLRYHKPPHRLGQGRHERSDIKQRLAVQGLYPVLTCGAEFADLIRQRCAAYGQAIKRARLKTE
jgi:hypothetical protein